MNLNIYTYYNLMSKFYFKHNNRIDYYYVDTNENIYDILDIHKENEPNYKYNEIGPIRNFKTAFSYNVLNILNRIGYSNINTFEHIKLYDVNDSYKIASKTLPPPSMEDYFSFRFS